MRLGEHLHDIFLDLMGGHRYELGRKDRYREIMVRLDVRPVISNHLENTATDTVPFDRGLRDLFTNDDRDAAMDAVFVLAVFEQDRAVTDRLAVVVEVTQAPVPVKAVFLR